MDLSGLYGADDATAQEQMQAQAAALRRQNALGVIGQLTGDKVLGGVGSGLIQNAQHQQDALNQIPGQRLKMALEQQQLQSGGLDLAASQRRQAALQNPNSPQTGLRLALAKRFGLNMPAGSTGETVDTQDLGLAEKAQEAEESRKERLQAAQLMANSRWGPQSGTPSPAGPTGPGGAPGEPPAIPMTPQQVQKEEQDFYKLTSKTQGRANLSSDNQRRVYAIERLSGLMNKPGGLTPEEMRLLETDLASVYAGGNAPTESAIEHLHAGTWRGSVAKTLEWALNSPQDAGAQAFLDRMRGNVGELKNTISQQILKSQASSLPRFFKTLRPRLGKQAFEDMLRGQEIDPALVDEHGLLKAATEAPTQAGSQDQHAAAIKWAKDNPNDPRAAKILRLNQVSP